MSFFQQAKSSVMVEDRQPKTGASVLVIDDEAPLREWLQRGLPTLGFQAATASDGSEAMEKIKHQRFDLIICDIKMPGQNGVNVLKDIKRIQPDVEVIMATGYGTVDTAVDSMKLGAYDYIAKPFTLDQLCAILEAALAIQRSRRTPLKRRKNKVYLRWLWLLPLGYLLLGGMERVWRLNDTPAS